MVTTVLQPDAVALESGVAEGIGVRVRDGEVIEVGRIAGGADRVVPIEGTLLPGLIDLQCNGAGGHSVDEANPAALDSIAQRVWQGGAVAFLPTLITAPFDLLLERLRAVAAWIEGARGGARPLGIHLEGPFLEVPGTHDPAHLIDPTPERIDAVLRAAGRHLALVTLAPAREGAAAAVARLRAAGVAVAIGHAASTDALEACVQAGASLVTHLFNAMGPLHHRDPGLAGRALDDQRLSCSLIPDGVHVEAAMVRNAWRCLGPERTILVTDSVAAAGMPDGEYRLSGAPIRLRDGAVRDLRGNLAGSALTMAEAARRWLAMVPSATAWSLSRVAAANPARLLGQTRLGAIAAGCAAELAVLQPDGGVRCWRAD